MILRERPATENSPPQFPLAVHYCIRTAVRSDVRKLEWYGAYSHTRRYIERAYIEMTKGRQLMLVADLNGFPIGQIYVQFDSKNKQHADGKTRGYIYSFRVIGHLQGMGIGTRLLRTAEVELARRGFRYAVLQVSKRNEAARRLYHREGYLVIDEDPGQWSFVDHNGLERHVNDPTFVMEKRLAPPL